MKVIRVSNLGISQQIIILATVLLLLMTTLVVAVIMYLARLARADQLSRLQYTSRAVADAVEADFARFMAVAQALSASPALLENDLNAFKAQALGSFPKGAAGALLVTDAEGREIMNSPFPAAMRESYVLAVQRKAFQTHSPAISGLYRSREQGDWLTSLEFPVYRDGKPYRTISITLAPNEFLGLLSDLQLPEGWTASIADADGYLVAETPRPGVVAGYPVPEGWRGTLHRPGMMTFEMENGEEMIAANAISPSSGWTIGVTAKADALQAPVWPILYWTIPSGIAALVTSLLFALWVARRIRRPIEDLEINIADSIQGRATCRAEGLPETDRVWAALERAIQDRKRAEDNLRAAEAMLSKAADGAAFGAYDFEVATRRLKWSPQLKSLLGLDSAEGLEVSAETAVSFIYPEDRDSVRAAVAEVIERQPQNYEIEFRAVRNDGEVRWLLDRGQTIKDPDTGRIAKLSGILIDITKQKVAELRLEAQLAQMDGLYRSAPIGLALLDRNARFIRVNEALAAMTGKTPAEHIGRTISDIIPNGGEAATYTLGSVIAEKKTAEIELRIQPYGGAHGAREWITKWYPVQDGFGNAFAGLIAEDVTDRNAADRQQKVLLDELSHRVKNTLAIVQAIATQTLESVRHPSAFAETFSGRLVSLRRAHDLLTKTSWEGASLEAIVREAIAPFVPNASADRIEISGPFVAIPAEHTVTLALMFHELVSNAAKYGALSAPSGRLTIVWELAQTPSETEVCVSWKEAEGPSVKEPAEQGFGTRLLFMSAEQLGGDIAIDYASTGLVCTLRFPLPQPPAEE